MTIISVYFSTSSRSPAKSSTRSFSCSYVQSNLFKMTALVFLICILTIAAQDTSATIGVSVGGIGTGSTRNIVRDGVDQGRDVAAEGAGAAATHIQPVRT
jgi:hypothetical protein